MLDPVFRLPAGRVARLFRSDAAAWSPADVDREGNHASANADARGMSFTTEWRYNPGEFARRRPPPNARPQRLLAGVALAAVTLACTWTLGVNLSGRATRAETDRAVADRTDSVARRGDKLATARPTSRLAANAAASDTEILLFDPRYFSGASPGSFAAMAALDAAAAPVQAVGLRAQQSSATTPSARQIVQSATSPVPQLRLAHNAPTREAAHAGRAEATAAADPQSTLFERLFGRPSPLTLAYASPDDAGLAAGSNIAAGRYDRTTAVYDISAHVVYMPDGSRLEAHSGYGGMLDDPRHADAKNRGVTPPNLYDLELREASFHGVRALRLKPEDESKVFGRSGLLAHSFMLGPNGDSNGCVSFRNYDAFLRAYLNHEITRLAVVARLD